jgi:hypothetical protein
MKHVWSMRKQEGIKSKARYISQDLKVHYKNIVKLVEEYSGHILPEWFFRVCIILMVNWGIEVREGIWKGIGTDIIYAREDLWKNRKECGARVSVCEATRMWSVETRGWIPVRWAFVTSRHVQTGSGVSAASPLMGIRVLSRGKVIGAWWQLTPPSNVGLRLRRGLPLLIVCAFMTCMGRI